MVKILEFNSLASRIFGLLDSIKFAMLE